MISNTPPPPLPKYYSRIIVTIILPAIHRTMCSVKVLHSLKRVQEDIKRKTKVAKGVHRAQAESRCRRKASLCVYVGLVWFP